jgi:hypothetical protein
MRTLFLCKLRISYGNSYGLLNSAGFIVDYLNSIGMESKLETVIDANAVDRVITEYDPLIIFIEALWITPEKLKEIMSLARHRKRLFVIRIHSRPTFIANEGIAFKWLLGYRQLKLRNLIIAPNNEEFQKDLKNTFGLNSQYLPNIYNPPKYEVEDSESLEDVDIIKIGCFGSLRPMKNHLTQAIAAVKFAKAYNKELEFHINSTRMEQHGDQVLQNLRYYFEGQDQEYKLVEHDWLSHKEFVELVKQMNIGLQVSLTETFNIVAADFVYHNIPVIGSAQIPWLPKRFQVDDPNSTEQIVKKLEYAWSFFGWWFNKSSKKSLIKSNKEAQKVWNCFVRLR